VSGPPSTQPAEPKESLYAMSTLTTRTIVPTGTWVIDQAHSQAGFAVNHTYSYEKVGNAGIWTGAGLKDGDLAQIELEMETNI
jgi:polyisoprenoid-binding protein YceI